MSAAARRRELGPAAVLSPKAAAELLPWQDARSRGWLKRHKLIRHDPDLGAFVIWGDVLTCLRQVSAPAEAGTPADERRPARHKLRRGGL